MVLWVNLCPWLFSHSLCFTAWGTVHLRPLSQIRVMTITLGSFPFKLLWSTTKILTPKVPFLVLLLYLSGFLCTRQGHLSIPCPSSRKCPIHKTVKFGQSRCTIVTDHNQSPWTLMCIIAHGSCHMDKILSSQTPFVVQQGYWSLRPLFMACYCA